MYTASPVATAKTNLGQGVTSFIGRESELATLGGDFDANARLVTLVGPGGIGKTTLATEFARTHAEAYSAHGGGGSWFVDLTAAAGLGDLCAAVAAGLGIRSQADGQGSSAIEQLGRQLAKRERLLVVLDNCEHLVGDLREAVPKWLAAAPRAQFLLTSRVALGVPGEQQRPVLGMSADDGARLFAQRAHQVAPDAASSSGDQSAIAEIVRRVDGFPLAIELAAARTRLLSPAQIEDRLSIQLLQRPGDSGRHGSLRTTILDSVTALTPVQRRFFANSAVFRGGFDAEASEHILAENDFDAVDALSSLGERSLLRAFSTDDGQRRFTLFETIREVAEELLQEEFDPGAVGRRHAEYFSQLSHRLSEQWTLRGDQRALARLVLERDNLVSAHRYAIAAGMQPLATRLMIALDEMLSARGEYRLRLELIERTTALDPCNPRLRLAKGDAQRDLGRLSGARDDLNHGRELANAAGDNALVSLADLRIGELCEIDGATAEARRHYERALSLLQQGDAPRQVGIAADGFALLGHALRREGELEDAEACFAKATVRYQSLGRTDGLGAMAYETGVIALFREDLGLAATRLEEGLQHAASAPRLLGAIHSGLGVLEQERGNLELAIRHHADAVRALRGLGNRYIEGSALYYLAGAYLELGQLVETHAVLDQARRAIEEAGVWRYMSLVEGARAVAYVYENKVAEARESLHRADRAATKCQSERSLLATLAIHRLQLSSVDTHQRVTEAKALVDSAPGDDPRFALRLLSQRPDRAAKPCWIVRPGASGFRAVDAHADVDLSRKRVLARIFAALVDKRMQAPGEPLALDDVLDAGWPGEDMAHTSAINRVHVAVSTLRKLGLRPVLLSHERGYLLDPSVPWRSE